MVVKNKICGNTKKAIQQGLACNMVGKGAEGLFQTRLAFFLFSLAGHFNWFKHLFATAFNPRFFFISFFLLLNEMTQRRAG